MTATYDPTTPTLRDRIRLLVGDTDVATDAETGESLAWLPDETYDSAILRTTSETGAIAEMAAALASKIAKDPDRYTDESGMSVSWSARVKTLVDLAKDMRAATAASVAALGGTTISVRPTRGGTTYPEYRRPDDWQYQE